MLMACEKRASLRSDGSALSILAPTLPRPYALLISCCGHLGLREEAQMLLVHRNTLGPPLTVNLNRSQLQKYATGPIIAEGLAKAGMPES
jgi:adenylate cyclase